jgi:hypothetical protein
VILYAGTFEAYQGVEILVEAFARVVQQRPTRACCWSAAPTSRSWIRALADSLGLGESLRAHRGVSKTADGLHGRADVLVSPRIDGTNTPLKIYEQLASGKPLVATRIWSHTQVLDDDVCFLVEPIRTPWPRGSWPRSNDRAGAGERVANAMALYEREYSRPVYEQKIRRLARDRRLMCGIAGIVALAGPAPSRDDVVRMCDAMTHRGPDDAGYLVEGQVALGMRRLSIIDLAGGTSRSSTRTARSRGLQRRDLQLPRAARLARVRGPRFSTNSDTEVIVHLWEQVGDDFPKHLNGMFAIALFDRARRRVVLARDHVGIKPLYYALGPGGAGVRLGGQGRARLGPCAAPARRGRPRAVPRLGVRARRRHAAAGHPAAGAGAHPRARPRHGPQHGPPLLAAARRGGRGPARSDAEWEDEVDAAARGRAGASW